MSLTFVDPSGFHNLKPKKRARPPGSHSLKPIVAEPISWAQNPVNIIRPAPRLSPTKAQSLKQVHFQRVPATSISQAQSSAPSLRPTEDPSPEAQEQIRYQPNGGPAASVQIGGRGIRTQTPPSTTQPSTLATGRQHRRTAAARGLTIPDREDQPPACDETTIVFSRARLGGDLHGPRRTRPPPSPPASRKREARDDQMSEEKIGTGENGFSAKNGHRGCLRGLGRSWLKDDKIPVGVEPHFCGGCPRVFVKERRTLRALILKLA